MVRVAWTIEQGWRACVHTVTGCGIVSANRLHDAAVPWQAQEGSGLQLPS